MTVHDEIARAVTRRRIALDEHQAEVLRRADELYVLSESSRLDVPVDPTHHLGTDDGSTDEHTT